MSNEFDFDAIPSVKIEGIKIDGKLFELREPNGDAITKYKNATLGATRFEGGKPVKVDGIADAEPLLVSLCLYEVKGPNTYRAVTVNEVRGWRSVVQRKLFNKIKEISSLADEEEDTVEKIEAKIEALKLRLERTKSGNTTGKE